MGKRFRVNIGARGRQQKGLALPELMLLSKSAEFLEVAEGGPEAREVEYLPLSELQHVPDWGLVNITGKVLGPSRQNACRDSRAVCPDRQRGHALGAEEVDTVRKPHGCKWSLSCDLLTFIFTVVLTDLLTFILTCILTGRCRCQDAVAARLAPLRLERMDTTADQMATANFLPWPSVPKFLFSIRSSISKSANICLQ